jgi:branched-chain amino acid transport system ATP-binding protein
MGLLEVKNLSRSFGGLRAVQDVSFSVEKNSIKAVIGPNGAGKTTLFNLISGMLQADAGEVLIDGHPINGQPPHLITRCGISRTFQNIKLFSRMSVFENVMLGRHIRSRSGFLSAMLHLPMTRREERAIREASMEILNMLGINNLAGTEATSLPFGQQRIVEIARALATEPSLLLLDEPAAGLNIYETAQISDMILKIRKKGITVLVIEHDMSLVMNISDEIVVLASGNKIAEGPPSDIQKNDEVIRVYLGEEDA